MKGMILKKIKLPTPKEMGVSDTDYLPLRSFSPETKNLCWEDFDDLLKVKYPIRFFLFKTLPEKIKYKIWNRYFVKLYNYIFFNFIKKHHLLDLRQIENDNYIDNYKYGYLPIPDKILYANFNILKQYIDSKPINLRHEFSEYDINLDPVLKHQQYVFDESHEIYFWWENTRKLYIKKLNDLFICYTKEHDKHKKQKLLKNIESVEKNIDDITDDILIRLIKIRKYLF